MSGYGWQECGNVQPAYNNCYSGHNNGSTFVLIVVLFILLIIVGSVFL
ncbi:YjcZ family sporulation protein [Solibacillus sp. CAU 1738]